MTDYMLIESNLLLIYLFNTDVIANNFSLRNDLYRSFILQYITLTGW